LQALEGIKILDLTRIGPGPFCTWILADLGAEVIKVEAPLTAGAREAGLFQSSILQDKDGKRTLLYWATNRNKKSIAINLKLPGGVDIFNKLALKADIIVEGFRPGAVQRLGIDYDTIKKINPRVIYCSITGYGQNGPYRDLPGHDINYISAGGVLNLIGENKGKPVIPLNLIGDYGGAGMNAVIGILAAIIARTKTGKGQFVDISLLDSVISILADTAVQYFQHKVQLERGKMVLGGAYPYYNIYETKDNKYISIGCLEVGLWENLCSALGKEEYIPYHFRHEHNFNVPEGDKWNEVITGLQRIFLSRTRDEWFDILSKKDVPVAKVLELGEVFSNPQVIERKMLNHIVHPTEGNIEQVGISIKLSDTPGEIRTLPPLLGQHTDEILTGIGYSAETIGKLHLQKVIA
jgi:crotonobetainyl-CoA:carnitine CoA-transferase CaiB-like acyl-CoA transferase